MFQASMFLNIIVPYRHVDISTLNNIDKIACSKEPSMFRASMFFNDIASYLYVG